MLYLGLFTFSIYLIFKFLYIVFPLFTKNSKEGNQEINKYKSFSILVPAYNEKDVIINCVKSLVNIDYPNYCVLIINDGSTDETFNVLNQYLFLHTVFIKESNLLCYERINSVCRSRRYPNFFVINKNNGGKADALNAGIACSRADCVVTLDADCILKQDAISIMNQVFQDEKVVAAGGTVHIIQGIESNQGKTKMILKLKNIIKFQILQYLTAFYLHKLTQSLFNALIVISGAYGAFDRNVLLEVKGYRKSVGEDMDITLKIHRFLKTTKKHIMTYIPQSVCYTECPENMKNLTKQRIRWEKAFIDCVLLYGTQMFRKFKSAISIFFIFDAFILGTLTSIVILLVPIFIIIGKQVSPIFIIFFSVDFILGIIESVVAIIISGRFNFNFSKRDRFRLCVFIPYQQVTYRFLNIIYVILGIISYIKNKNYWNKADRVGRTFAQPYTWKH